MKNLILFALALVCQWAAAESYAQADYKIAPNDTIIIDIFGEKELSRAFKVSATGTINYFFLGEVKVGGKTTSEVREELTKALNADYLVEPQIAIDVQEYRVREVFVNGEVNKPGSILLTGEQEMNILQAIMRAGGLTRRASEGKIKFTRPGQRERVFSFDELKNDPKIKDLPLEPGDIIEVGDKLL